MNEKTCTKCGEIKPLGEFNRLTTSVDGRQPRCRDCERQHRLDNRDARLLSSRRYYERTRIEKRLYAEKNRDRISAYQRKYRAVTKERDRSKKAASARSRRARLKSLPHETVTILDISLRDGSLCWMCGCELSEYDKSHVDHLIPLSADEDALAMLGVQNPGTVRANMALTCPMCNVRKSNRLMLCAVARYLRNLIRSESE